MKNFIQNELVNLRALEPVGSDRYNQISDAIRWVEDHASKEEKIIEKPKYKYALTTIKWKADEQQESALISLHGYDKNCMFCCNNEDEFEHLKDYNNETDFVVVGCTLFKESI